MNTMEHSPTEYDAFLLGYSYYKLGGSIKDNPFMYTTHDEEHNLWCDGWEEAQKDWYIYGSV